MNINNNRKEGKLIINKIDGKTRKSLKGAKIELYFIETGKKVFAGKTDKNGKLKIDRLIAGKYCIKEVKAPRDYEKTKSKECFELSEENEKITIVLKNNKKEIRVPNTGLFNILTIVIGIIIISSTTYLVYEKKHYK